MQKQDENIAKIAEDFFHPSNCSVSFFFDKIHVVGKLSRIQQQLELFDVTLR